MAFDLNLMSLQLAPQLVDLKLGLAFEKTSKAKEISYI